jgi:hypothetical protein
LRGPFLSCGTCPGSTDRIHLPWIPMSNGKKTPLNGLELTTEVILSTDAANKQASRRNAGLDLAAALLEGSAQRTGLPS